LFLAHIHTQARQRTVVEAGHKDTAHFQRLIEVRVKLGFAGVMPVSFFME
jgi:hypothetical protein